MSLLPLGWGQRSTIIISSIKYQNDCMGVKKFERQKILDPAEYNHSEF
jgi:hypothetical protein